MRKIIALGVAALVVACVTKLPPPKITYGSNDFRPAAVAAEEPRPVTLITLPMPLPLPGQLKPLEKETTPDPKPNTDTPTERVDAANEQARVEPDVEGYVNAIQVFPYTEGALYRLYAAPEQVSNIALQPREKLISVSAGDTVRWVVGDTTSGQGADERTHILVKPIAAGLKTNLVITTDRRTYHLELESTEETYMASVSWTYPFDELVALQSRNRQAEAAEDRVIDRGLDLLGLRFRYDIEGDDPPWRPLRAFDDGKKVYIQFPRGLAQGEAPPLFVVGPGGGSVLVNYRVKGAYYIVDRLFAAAELRLGKEPQQVVRITRIVGTE